MIIRVNKTIAYRDPKYFGCCVGFCIDLLQKLSEDLKFSFELNRVEDGAWGVLNVSFIINTWNELPVILINWI